MDDNNIITNIIDYIEDNLNDKLSLDKISEKANYSKFHLNRLFLECVGYTIYKYIQMRRLTIAAEKLVYTNESIVEIAYEANYVSQQSFTLAFRQLYFYTPQKYRVIGIHTPKLNRFTISNDFNIIYNFTMKYRSVAA